MYIYTQRCTYINGYLSNVTAHKTGKSEQKNKLSKRKLYFTFVRKGVGTNWYVGPSNSVRRPGWRPTHLQGVDWRTSNKQTRRQTRQVVARAPAANTGPPRWKTTKMGPHRRLAARTGPCRKQQWRWIFSGDRASLPSGLQFTGWQIPRNGGCRRSSCHS